MKTILNCPCLAFPTIEQAKEKILELIRQGQAGGYAVAINAEKIMRYRKDAQLRKIIDSSIFPTPDGAGAVLGLRLLWGINSIKLDLPKTILELANEEKLRLFVGGASEEVNAVAVRRIAELYPNISICGRIHGFCNEDVILDAIMNAHPHIIFLALGSPKQEIFAAKIHQKIDSAFIVGCGGALDILAGRVKRAPNFMVNNNLEWLYRLWKDPARWRRQSLLPIFFLRLLGAAFRHKLETSMRYK